jgi:hypothetical protein
MHKVAALIVLLSVALAVPFAGVVFVSTDAGDEIATLDVCSKGGGAVLEAAQAIAEPVYMPASFDPVAVIGFRPTAIPYLTPLMSIDRPPRA